MLIARVTGLVVSTMKHESLVGSKLLIVRETDVTGKMVGGPMVAVDAVDAGEGLTRFKEILSTRKPPLAARLRDQRLTLEQKTVFKKEASLPGEFRLFSEPAGSERRKHRARGWIEDAAGRVLCEGEGLYLMQPKATFAATMLPMFDFSGCAEAVRSRYGVE